MLHDAAQIERHFQRFLSEITENEIVFYLSNAEGTANSVSNDDEEVVILMFWSHRALAARANTGFTDDYDVTEMTLFDFLYRWLPGMSTDGLLAGPEWNRDLAGREIDPFELREEIENRLPQGKLAEYEARYIDLVGNP